jgi:ectoine hydroxylase
MSNFSAYLKKFKPTHWLYNLWHYKQLHHNKAAYKTNQIHKPLFASISSKDFFNKTSTAWLDVGNSQQLVPQHAEFASFAKPIQNGLINWSDNGYMILENFFDEATVTNINKAVETIVQKGLIQTTHDNKLPFANKISTPIKNITYTPELLKILNFILGKEVVPFQTLNFIKGSNQKAHSDSIHMTTQPLGYLIAVWIALEDTNPNNGPLFYYKGSHKLPYILNPDFNEESGTFTLGKKEYTHYEAAIENEIKTQQLQPEIFYAKKGDIFIWHANLLHGGLPTIDSNSTRKSMVIHYYAKDVIKYHEISERPSLLVE